MKKHTDLLEKFQAQCRHLLVDEYQDINAAQFELIRLLSAKHPHGLFVVGDDDQSIYSWRGGSPKFIRRFKEDFGRDACVETLRVSFRCHQHVLEGLVGVLSRFDKGRIDKGTFTYDDKVTKGPKIQVHSVASDEKEALGVRRIIQDALPSRDVLVLVAHKGYSVALCRALAAAKIPYIAAPVMPGDGLPVIAALGCWLRYPSDGLSFRLCLEHFLENCPRYRHLAFVGRKRKQEREALFQLVSELWKPVLAKEATDLWDSLLKSDNKPRIIRQAHTAFSKMLAVFAEKNVSAFVSNTIDVLGVWKKPDELLDETEAWMNFFEQSNQQGLAAVRIMTCQGAKGLEAHVVCVLGVEEGTMPRGDDSRDQLAEDARLFYVSATRAKDELHLFHARKRSGGIVFRNIYKEGAPPDLKPSRFLDHIDKAHKDHKYHQA